VEVLEVVAVTQETVVKVPLQLHRHKDLSAVLAVQVVQHNVVVVAVAQDNLALLVVE
tara:strand:- start:66 stop:236 length:171 start_codon:yes stop_codon:yes gene_type:complete